MMPGIHFQTTDGIELIGLGETARTTLCADFALPGDYVVLAENRDTEASMRMLPFEQQMQVEFKTLRVSDVWLTVDELDPTAVWLFQQFEGLTGKFRGAPLSTPASTVTHAFGVFGGIPQRGIYDKMRTAIDRVGRGKERDVNARFLAMASHYLFEPEFCNPASGWEKGQVEKNVQDARHRLWQPTPRFPTLDALNDWLEGRCRELWAQTAHGRMGGTIADLWAEEAPTLMPASRPFDGFVEYTKRATPTCLVHLERNRYSVPASFANRPVSLRVYPDRIVVAAEGMVICEHHRIIDRSHDQPGRTIYDWRHYLAVVQRKPGALRNGAPFAELPEAFRTLQQYLLKKPAVIARWWRSWHWSCSTTRMPYSWPSRWR
jgi:hypothetical protein